MLILEILYLYLMYCFGEYWYGARHSYGNVTQGVKTI